MIDSKKYVGERYESKHGKYEIIEYLGGNHPKVKVKFDLTGSEVICRYDTACKGFALDPNYINFTYVGKTYNSDYGPVTILRYLGRRKKIEYVEIKFEVSGYVCEKRLKNVISGKVKDPTYFMHSVKDKVFHSNNYGDYKILAEAGIDKNNAKLVHVHFIATGYEYDVRYDAALEGKVKDPTYFMYTVKDKIFHSNNYGEFKIIEQAGYSEDGKHKLVKIQFIRTGVERIVKYDDILKGEVRDTSYKNKYQAIQVLGYSYMQDVNRVLKTTWHNMMNRCYDVNSNGYSTHGAKGVTVAPEWHDFETFKRDVMNIPGWLNKYNNPAVYELDKDLFQYNTPYSCTVYSKDTCIWLYKSLNVQIAGRPRYAANIYYNSIYEVCNNFYVKTLVPTLPNYGPFNSLDAAINMLNYCYTSIGLYQLMIPIENKMTQQQIFQHTDDRRIVITRVENK